MENKEEFKKLSFQEENCGDFVNLIYNSFPILTW